eukprot:TRINITY_DN40378_c0_g1_i1.p1 TRINITY_DN40378_c0_g1~~TRINITY_DN40378_c0_g1_i1.p1  ORF type:complete len:501 (+),score=25.96 TRINITY_DN40378_c0_g1_i1:142-1644(+)
MSVSEQYENALAQRKSSSQTRNVVVMFPAFQMGHLIPMTQLAKQLSSSHGFSVILLVADFAATRQELDRHQKELVEFPGISFVRLPPLKIRRSTSDYHEMFDWLLEESKAHLRHALEGILEANTVSAFILDFLCYGVLDVPLCMKLPAYVFFVSNASFLCLLRYAPFLAEKEMLPLKESDPPVAVPGLPRMPFRDISWPFGQDNEWQWFVKISRRLGETRGFLINTFAETEKEQIQSLKYGAVCADTKEYYAVGPLIRSSDISEEEKTAEYLQWLDLQPLESVIYVSFGSSWQLSAERIRELATGLESSGQRFLWVLRRPHFSKAFRPETEQDEKEADKKQTTEEEEDMRKYLPEGFEERTEHRGLVWTSWAQQVAVLSHPSVSGFLSHCGWNSTLESLFYGVPMVTWPLGAEQSMNAFMLAEEWRVGMRLRTKDDGVVRAQEIQRVLTELMQGQEGNIIRERMKILSGAARSAIAVDGPSSTSLADFAGVLRTRFHNNK